MADQAALLRALAEFAQTIVGEYEVGDLLYRLSDQVVEVLGVTGTGVSLTDEHGVLRFVTATSEDVERVEKLQDEGGEGPCHDAVDSAHPITVPDLNENRRWPKYTAGALEVGLQAVAGIPMQADGHTIGALNLYDRRPHPWAPDDIVAAQLLADMATGYIINSSKLAQSRRLAEQLQHALDSRVVVEQAKGVLAGRLNIEVSEAFQLLRSHARANSTKVHAVARTVIDGTLRLGGQDS